MCAVLEVSGLSNLEVFSTPFMTMTTFRLFRLRPQHSTDLIVNYSAYYLKSEDSTLKGGKSGLGLIGQTRFGDNRSI